jgi:hypothetical protein
LACRRCGNTGEAVFSHHHGNRPGSRDDARLEYVPGGFEIVRKGKSVDILCDLCHRSALPRPARMHSLFRAVSRAFSGVVPGHHHRADFG